MTDKQKLIEWIDRCEDTATIEDIINTYLMAHEKDFPATRLNELRRIIDYRLMDEVYDLERGVRIARERATYLKCYLEGNMYASEEVARQCVDMQIENAKAILENTERVAL